MPRVKGNRLRKAQLVAGSDTTTIGEYEYFGDNRRSKKVVSNHGPEVVANDGGNTTVVFYYDRRWRIVETRNGSNQTTFQHLWGTRYTDELIWLEKNGDPTKANDTNPDYTASGEETESVADMRYFVHQDRNWNVVALTEYDPQGTNNGRIVERYSYTPYGSFVVLTGDSGNAELCNVKLTSVVGNVFAHQGLPFDHEKANYQNRSREYTVSLQRFAERDPLAGHPMVLAGLGGAALYEYLESNPAMLSDPAGLWAGCFTCTWRSGRCYAGWCGWYRNCSRLCPLTVCYTGNDCPSNISRFWRVWRLFWCPRCPPAPAAGGALVCPEGGNCYYNPTCP
jgi:RHS repeat-associated protein